MRCRVRTIFAPVVAVGLCLAAARAGAAPPPDGMNSPHDTLSRRTEAPALSAPGGVGPATFVVRGLFAVYQRGVGPTKGTSCPMIPSCSEYGRLSVNRHGLALSVLLTADRLHRCGHDLHLYPRLWSASRGWFYVDPPR
jgi:hypothetical protein